MNDFTQEWDRNESFRPSITTPLSSYPPVEQIIARRIDPLPEWAWRHHKSSNNDLRLRAIVQFMADLKSDGARYEHIREHGWKALSASDIEICARGNKRVAESEALYLKWNHITYDLIHLQHAEREWPSLYEMAKSYPASPSIPPAPLPQGQMPLFGA